MPRCAGSNHSRTDGCSLIPNSAGLSFRSRSGRSSRSRLLKLKAEYQSRNRSKNAARHRRNISGAIRGSVFFMWILFVPEPSRLACGTAAMAFDPLCGDGTSHAVREAILAAAIIQAAANGENEEELRSHYETRLLAGFGRHLALCSQFYKTGHRGPWWEQELKSLEEGMAWCGQQLGSRRDFHYQLNGFELQPTAS